MIKSLASLLIFLALGASVIALPGFAPKVEASQAPALAKGDRLGVRAIAVDCSKEVWPHLSTSCLQSAGGNILEARLVTARR
jgi:hypothetical protein